MLTPYLGDVSPVMLANRIKNSNFCPLTLILCERTDWMNNYFKSLKVGNYSICDLYSTGSLLYIF